MAYKVIILYRLYMPSYVLGTFTEYPYVPVFAIGAGADLFQGRIDNTEIPIKIAKAAGYTAE